MPIYENEYNIDAEVLYLIRDLKDKLAEICVRIDDKYYSIRVKDMYLMLIDKGGN